MLSQILTKEILSAIAVVITIVSYIPYVSDIYKGETRPHVFSWIIWGLLTGITYTAQVVEGGGVGTWSMGLTFILCISVGIKFLLVTLALENINLTTVLYPITVIWLNVGFVILILYRRKILATAKVATRK